MKRILSVVTLGAALILLLLIDIFFSALIPPFNAIEIIAIGILLIYLATSLEHAYIAALVMGSLEDYAALRYVGVKTIFYLLALTTIAFAHRTVITHENTMTILVSGVLFFAIISALQFVQTWELSYSGIEEMLFQISINSALAGMGYFVIKKIQREIDKRFL